MRISTHIAVETEEQKRSLITSPYAKQHKLDTTFPRRLNNL